MYMYLGIVSHGVWPWKFTVIVYSLTKQQLKDDKNYEEDAANRHH